VVVGRDYDTLRSDLSVLTKLVFSWEWLVLSPSLEVAEHEFFVFFDIIDEYCFLVGVPVPVFGLVFLEVVWVLVEDVRCLVGSSVSTDPQVL